MAGVYVPGVGLPENCFQCAWSIRKEMTCRCPFCDIVSVKYLRDSQIRPKQCPLIAVPDNGLLTLLK